MKKLCFSLALLCLNNSVFGMHQLRSGVMGSAVPGIASKIAHSMKHNSSQGAATASRVAEPVVGLTPEQLSKMTRDVASEDKAANNVSAESKPAEATVKPEATSTTPAAEATKATEATVEDKAANTASAEAKPAEATVKPEATSTTPATDAPKAAEATAEDKAANTANSESKPAEATVKPEATSTTPATDAPKATEATVEDKAANTANSEAKPEAAPAKKSFRAKMRNFVAGSSLFLGCAGIAKYFYENIDKEALQSYAAKLGTEATTTTPTNTSGVVAVSDVSKLVDLKSVEKHDEKDDKNVSSSEATPEKAGSFLNASNALIGAGCAVLVSVLSYIGYELYQEYYGQEDQDGQLDN